MISVRSIKTVSNLFFISVGILLLLNDKSIRLFCKSKGSNPVVFTHGSIFGSSPLNNGCVNNWLSLGHGGLLLQI